MRPLLCPRRTAPTGAFMEQGPACARQRAPLGPPASVALARFSKPPSRVGRNGPGVLLSKVAALEDLLDRVLLPTEDHVPVTIAVDKDPSPDIQAGFGKNPEGDLHGPVVVDDRFKWLSDHRSSLPAPSSTAEITHGVGRNSGQTTASCDDMAACRVLL